MFVPSANQNPLLLFYETKANDLFLVIEIGVLGNRRSVARTEMNDTSSRSHFLMMLKIHGVNESSGEQVNGSLCFIDLAGSESPSTSGTASDKDRFEETKAINKSLSFLGDVIHALARKDHVPYQNSTLTRLLQPCMEGDGKTLMFVNVSPYSESSVESSRSLRFAEKLILVR